MKKYLFALIFLGTLAVSGLHCAPYYAVNKVQKAAVQGDFATLADYIDESVLAGQAQKLTMERVASILAQSMEPQAGQESLDMTMGFSGDEHFMLSLQGSMANAVPSAKSDTGPEASANNAPFMGPVIFVFEKQGWYAWHITEILINE